MLFNFMKQKQTWKSTIVYPCWIIITLPFCFLVHCWMHDLTGGSISGALSNLLSPSIGQFVFLFSIKVLTKLLRNYAACERHLFNGSAPYSGGSRPSDNGGSAHPDPEIRRGEVRLQKNFFSALRASVWSNNKGGQPPPRAPPLDRPLP